MSDSDSKVTPENFKHFAGYRACRKARSTGTIISVVDGLEQGLDLEGGRWYTVCEEHDTTVSHGSLTLAFSHASQPEHWCEKCRKIWDQKQKQIHDCISQITSMKNKNDPAN